MRLSSAKDAILKYLIKEDRTLDTTMLYKPLKMDYETCFEACKELIKDEKVTGSINDGEKFYGKNGVTITVTVNNSGRYFAKHKNYRKQSVGKFVVDMPKNFWFIGLLIVMTPINVKELYQLLSNKNKQHTQPAPPLKQRASKTSTLPKDSL